MPADENAELRSRIIAALQLHRAKKRPSWRILLTGKSSGWYCEHDKKPWPCPTKVILSGRPKDKGAG